jgi:spermidine synthase
VSGAPAPSGKPAGGGEHASRAFSAYLIATAIVCGALVMVIEVLGSRVIGPFFGVSLFVWTSLITVTLVALAAGYAAGGILADRRGSPDMLYGIILLAGVFTLLIPLLKGPVLKATLSWGLRAGALSSSLALFGPALFLLGCVSPYLVRIAARELQSLGRTVGLFYAFSTAGSFIGTVLTGFVLIAAFGVDTIFLVVGALLLALGAGHFVLLRRRWSAALVLILPLLLAPPARPAAKVLDNGTTATRVHAKDTPYGSLAVVDYTYGPLHHRDLMIDGLTQGGIDVDSRLSLYPYAYALQFLPYALNPSGATCLVIGLGAGVVPVWYEQRGVRTDVVDIDPEVVAAARQFFGFSVSGDVITADARYYLNTTTKRYDYVILDVFNGDTTPGHVLSREALLLVRARMSDRGILAVNLIGSVGRDRFMTASVIRTLEGVFREVNLYPLFEPAENEGNGNITVIASPAPLPPFDRSVVEGFPVHPQAEPAVARYLGRPYRFPSDAAAVVLTDDYNPIDVFDVRLKEWLRRSILENIDRDILI